MPTVMNPCPPGTLGKSKPALTAPLNSAMTTRPATGQPQLASRLRSASPTVSAAAHNGAPQVTSGGIVVAASRHTMAIVSGALAADSPTLISPAKAITRAAAMQNIDDRQQREQQPREAMRPRAQLRTCEGGSDERVRVTQALVRLRGRHVQLLHKISAMIPQLP